MVEKGTNLLSEHLRQNEKRYKQLKRKILFFGGATVFSTLDGDNLILRENGQWESMNSSSSVVIGSKLEDVLIEFGCLTDPTFKAVEYNASNDQARIETMNQIISDPKVKLSLLENLNSHMLDVLIKD